MAVEREVANYYAHGALIEAIEAALTASGIERDAVTVADLAPVDEFHIGGRPATVDLAGQLALAPSRTGCSTSEAGSAAQRASSPMKSAARSQAST